MPVSEVNFSDLSNQPLKVVGQVERSATRSVRIRRRGKDVPDLLLVTEERAAQVTEVVTATTKMFLALMEHDDEARSLATEVVPVAFPWVRFLPKEDVRAFVVELVETLAAAESLRNPAPVANLVAAWRHTAEVHADPELAAILQRDGDDLGLVPAPGEVE
ncbi:hypothetical protein [Amycolatopsis sp. 195334CR]|uniref:hypothetical protein n=1 Tax=Amycolatopsis sp. 195334CR TaxID=2814588 RepID=UPI001A8EB572|nr:hypothetical protein [Amycolatopsis sp. 195334CR]MBN6036286.1 hypothetical protein [Amycolatopsis sp. 195334CR]